MGHASHDNFFVRSLHLESQIERFEALKAFPSTPSLVIFSSKSRYFSERKISLGGEECVSLKESGKV